MTFKRTASAALTATLTAAMLIGNTASARPLGEELQKLLVEHPLLKSLRKSVEASDKGRDVAKAGYYPRINLSGDTGQEKIVNPGIETDLNRRRLTATIEQNLYAGGRTRTGVAIAEIEYAAQNNSLQQNTQDVLFEAIVAYIQVARYQTLIAIARRNEETTQSQLGLENQRVERGGGIAVDVMQARARLQLVKERRVFYEQGLRDALANYLQVFGHEPDLNRMQEVGIFTGQIPTSLEAALTQGRQQNPRLQEIALQAQKAQKQIANERAGLYPTVDLVGTRVADRNANAIARRDETSLLLRFNWNIYAGMETTNRTKAVAIQHEALLDREVALTNKADEAVRIAWNQLINGREREELLDSAASISFDVMQSRKRLRDAGREAAINVLDAEVEYYGVLSNRLNALHDTRIGSYRLLAAMGALTPASLGLTTGNFALPVKPLSLDIGRLDGAAAAPSATPAPR